MFVIDWLYGGVTESPRMRRSNIGKLCGRECTIATHRQAKLAPIDADGESPRFREMITLRSCTSIVAGDEENMIRESRMTQLMPEIILLCSFCDRLQNDGEWKKIDGFVEKHPCAHLSHGICPECARAQFPEEYAAICADRRMAAVKHAESRG